MTGVLPPPFHHLNHLRLSLCSRWRAEELEAEFTVNIQHPVCANQLEDTRKKHDERIKRSNKKFFLNDQAEFITLRKAHAIFLNPRSCLSTSTLALASSIVMKSRIFTKMMYEKITSMTGSCSKIGATWKVSYFKEEQNSGAFILLFNKVTKALIEENLFLPLRDD